MDYLTIAFNSTDSRVVHPNGWLLDTNWLSRYFENAALYDNIGMLWGCRDYKEFGDYFSNRVPYETSFVFDPKFHDIDGFKIKNVETLSSDEKYIYPIRIYGRGHVFQEINMGNTIHLSSKIVDDCRNRKCKILFNEVFEGHGANLAEYKDFFEKVSNDFKIPIESIGFVDSNLKTPELQAMYNTKGFSCLHFEIHSYDYRDYTPLFAKLLKASKHYDEKKQKRFICLNRRLRNHRNVITSEIVNNHAHNTLWSYTEATPESFNRVNNIKYPDDVRFDTLLPFLPKLIDVDESVNDTYVNEKLQRISYINIVNETIFYNDNSIFLSEKVFKPIIFGQPFILVGSPNTLSSLRDKGYKTFYPYINEDYDLITDNDMRMESIIKEIRRLSSMKDHEFSELYSHLKSVCLHNIKNYHSRLQDKSAYRELISNIKEWVNE
jgi:hypothetical protein